MGKKAMRPGAEYPNQMGLDPLWCLGRHAPLPGPERCPGAKDPSKRRPRNSLAGGDEAPIIPLSPSWEIWRNGLFFHLLFFFYRGVSAVIMTSREMRRVCSPAPPGPGFVGRVRFGPGGPFADWVHTPSYSVQSTSLLDLRERPRDEASGEGDLRSSN